MNFLSYVLIGGALVAVAVAIDAAGNLPVAVPMAAVAIALVTIVGAVELATRSVQLAPARAGILRQAPRFRMETDSLLRLRLSFGAGEMGRSSILASIRALERDLSPFGRTPLTLEAERSILDLPPDQFQRWVDDRLKRIEAAT